MTCALLVPTIHGWRRDSVDDSAFDKVNVPKVEENENSNFWLMSATAMAVTPDSSFNEDEYNETIPGMYCAMLALYWDVERGS